jgi:serine/threonine protein kinase/tetratricopeptide (TPR) repeat protein
MDSDRWQRIQRLFHEALDLPHSDRHTFLQSACVDDQDLAAEIMSMLEQDAGGSSLLDRNLAEVAHQTLADRNLFTPGSLSSQEFGPYRILGFLGEGGMGVVYLAERIDFGNQVAIKVLRDAWLSPSRRERFASEQRTLAQLNHPSIAQLYDADTLPDGTPWFVMELVNGVPLTEYCQRRNSSVEDRLQLFRSVCEAVQFAHGNAVIHRDLKPSNILVKDDGTLRLLDFGIAKQLESLDVPVDQTLTGLRLMTPAYAAPEQIRGDRVGIHTDVYSLGVVLFELLTGQLPFDLSNLTPAEAATVITEHDPGKPSTVARMAGFQANRPPLRKAAWADLDVLCLTAMHKDPQRRYRSVEALIRDVDHYLNAEPLEARPDTLSYRTGKFVRRHSRAVTAAALVFVVIVGLVAFFTWRLTKARNAALAEAAKTQRVQQFMMNLFQGGDEAVGPAADMKVLTMVDRGVQQAQALSTDPKVQAELYLTLGSIYQKLGKLDQAESLLRQALAQRQTLFGPDSAEVAESLVALGQLRAEQAHMDEAEQMVRQGLEMTKRHLPPNHPAVAKGTAALGKILEDRGQYDQSIQVLNEAVRLQSASGVATPDLAASLSELANSHFYAGHYDISDSLNRRVLEMHRSLYGEHHPLVADTLINLGEIQVQAGHYEQAEQFDRQALEITESWYGHDHPETASAMTILGRVLVYEKHYDDADNFLQQALAVQERVYGPVHPRVASVLNDLGKVAQNRGNLDESEADFRRMAEIYRTVYHDHHYLIAVALSNLGSVYLEKKQYARAEESFRDVIKRFTETLSADHVNTGIARTKLGKTLLLERRYAEAEVESRAGYEILVKQMAPNVSWLARSRQDLVEEYDALNQPEKAAKFRSELSAAAKPESIATKN